MSIFSRQRKASIQARKLPRPDPKEELEVRVARRICSLVYARGCQCSGYTNGKPNVCDNMRLAAQGAMKEILS